MRRLIPFVLILATLTASCNDTPTGLPADEPPSGEMVITPGLATPGRPPYSGPPSLSEAGASITSTLGGSATTPVSLTPQTCSATASQQVVITYSITGNQEGTATFKVHTSWSHDGSGWSGSSPATLTVPPRASRDAATIRQVTVTVANASTRASGSSNFSIVPFDLTNSNATGAKLGINSGNVTVHVEFAGCAVANTAPTLVLPSDMTVEATSSAGATVNFSVTANDLEDGDLTADVVCSPASGSTFTLGTTKVSCQVTDSHGVTTPGSFNVTVEDTTPAYFTSFPTGTMNLIAASISGAVLDIGGLVIAVEDVGNVSEPSTFSCDYVAGTPLGIGTTTTITCKARDAIGNESAASTFDVFVGLRVGDDGFLPPLRMTSPYSLHKRGSTVPHKFLPPTYADGTPAIDLAGGLKLVIRRLDGTVDPADIEVNDYSTGSTEWRYDLTTGQYIFNLKTGTSSPWDPGSWRTSVSYAGIVLATTTFDLKK